MPVNASNSNFGWKAKNFKLKSVDEQVYSLRDLQGLNGTVIVFICNHCPYVKAIADKLSYESKELFKININTIAIMSNDVESYPEDSFENMKIFLGLIKIDINKEKWFRLPVHSRLKKLKMKQKI